ncbi:MAG: NUDIX domain-containing protein [Verrucomicrobia bacterium]|nr:NUDIX domain-containing protein [Verrucomicrobiota bacterium]
MPHIHEKIDFTVSLFIVQDGKVLLIHHKKLDAWLPIGGHIELDEDPEQAAYREAREECGLEIELIGERQPTTGPGTRALVRPRFLDIHRVSPTQVSRHPPCESHPRTHRHHLSGPAQVREGDLGGRRTPRYPMVQSPGS